MRAQKRFLLTACCILAATAGCGPKTRSLHEAIQLNDTAEILAHIEKGADLNAKDAEGVTPLNRALENDQNEAAKLLIAHGADPNVPGPEGFTPLHLAVSYGDPELVLALLDHGADVNAKDTLNQSTPLIQACASGNVGLVELLLQRGADPSLVSANGFNATQTALDWGNAQVMKVLLDSGQPVTMRLSRHGETLLHLAAYHGLLDAAQILIEKGHEIDPRDTDSATPLHIAAVEGHLDMVKFLVEHGADINAREGKYQATPLFIARRKGYDEMAAFFESKGAEEHGEVPAAPANNVTETIPEPPVEHAE